MTDGPPQHDQTLDCLGQACPLPVLRARKTLARMAVGEVLRIDASDPMARLDIPAMARSDGHEVLAERMDGAQLTFWIRRAASG